MAKKINKKNGTLKNRLILYHFYEKDEEYIKNFIHFLLFGYDESNDYVVIIAGDYSIELPRLKKIHYVFTENINNDFGGYCAAIHQIPNILEYQFVFFINSSVRGPFKPNYCRGSWVKIFEEKFADNVGIVGSTINILSRNSLIVDKYPEYVSKWRSLTHVQTMAYVLPRFALKHLLDINFYHFDKEMNKEEVILNYEINLSQLLLNQGWNLRCLISEYNGFDYRNPHDSIDLTSNGGDINHKYSYFGRTPHPYETVFIKTNRNLVDSRYLDRLAYSTLSSQNITEEKWKDPLILSYIKHLKSVPESSELVIEKTNGINFKPEQILSLTNLLIQQEPSYLVVLKEIVRMYEK